MGHDFFRRRKSNCAGWLVLTASGFGWAAEPYPVEYGEVSFTLNEVWLENLGVAVAPARNAAVYPTGTGFRFDAVEYIPSNLSEGLRNDGSLTGSIRVAGGLVFLASKSSFEIEQVLIQSVPAGKGIQWSILDGTQPAPVPLLVLGGFKIGADAISRTLRWETADLIVTAELARALGSTKLEGRSLGSMRGSVAFTPEAMDSARFAPAEEQLSNQAGQPADAGPNRGGNNGTDCWNMGEPEIGPDVIVGDLIGITNYGVEGGIKAYAVGTTSCNIGSANLLWEVNTPNVPVIGQNMYRLKNGRFEQIGQSWLKYAFTALTQNVCGCGCSGQGGSVLGVGCSDPYCCGLNGIQDDLGPRYEVNAFIGAHPGFHANPPYAGEVARRLQVSVEDFIGGLYFVEGQYVTPDDAAAGNQFNNASYRRVDIDGLTYDASYIGSTVREQPAIHAWKATEPTVTLIDIMIPNEGLITLAYKTTDLGAGYWHYEFALHNLNSDRSIGSFSVPVDDQTTVQNIEFHDVAYHSGEPFDGTDWPNSRSGGSLTWSTTPFAVNANANALRWGTLYNFRFDAFGPPVPRNITVGLFKPGSPTEVTVAAVGPDFVPCMPGACGDPLFCNGEEICNGDQCVAGVDPCAGMLCVEQSQSCQNFPDMYCLLPGSGAPPDATVSMDIYLRGVNAEVRSYASTISITQSSGSGSVSLLCPEGTEIDTGRPNYVFYNAPNVLTTPSCPQNRVGAVVTSGSVEVDSEPAYLGTFHLTVSPDATKGSIFDIAITPPGGGTYVRDENNAPMTFNVLPACTLTIQNCNPCQLYGDIEPIGTGPFVGDCDVDVDDIVCALAGFIHPPDCTTADIEPCGSDGDMDSDDLLAVLAAFIGSASCPIPCP